MRSRLRLRELVVDAVSSACSAYLFLRSERHLLGLSYAQIAPQFLTCKVIQG